MLAFNLLGDGLRDALDVRMRAANERRSRADDREPPLLEVDDLHVEFDTYGGIVQAVRGVSFNVEPGEDAGDRRRIGLRQIGDRAEHHGPDPDAAGAHHARSRAPARPRHPAQQADRRRRRSRRRVGMIFQDPMSSLNPTMTVGDQIAETLVVHRGLQQQAGARRAVELLDRDAHSRAAKRARQYPFEFSGGMLQRAMIAMAIACEPTILIADEPTTALDVTIQAQILDLLKDLQRETGMAIILITHDLGVVARMADRRRRDVRG